MKKLLPILLCLLLCACTEKPAPEQQPAQPPQSAPAVETAAPVMESAAPAAETQAPAPKQSLFDAAKALEGESVEELLSAVGEPVSREEYMPSCLGDGEDGLWHYADFDVYTYREGGRESVYAVMAK